MGVASGSGWNLRVWLAGGGCGWNLWVWLLDVVVRRYIDFLILLIPTPLVYVIFAAAYLLFVHFLNGTFCNKILDINIFFHIAYTHIRVTTGVPRQPYEGLHMFYTRSTHK